MSIAFREFLREHKILSLVIATLVSNSIAELIVSLTNNIFIPVFDVIDINSDNKSDRVQLKNFNVKIKNVQLNLGAVILSIIKLLVILLIVYFISHF